MAKVVIGIHGLGNKPPKSTLEKWWMLAINEGLQKTGKPTSPYKFELVFWADIIHDKLLNENCTNVDDPQFIHEKYYPANGNYRIEDHSKRRIILDFLTKQINSLFLNEDFTLNYSFITDTILHRYFKDLDIYYAEKDANAIENKTKELIRQRVVQVLKKYKDDEILVIGLSMGSIIGFDVLAFDLPSTKIDTFITMGSPLGVPIVKSKIAAERKLLNTDKKLLTAPSSVYRHWYNFSDLEDKVAFNYQLSDDFEANKNLVKPIDFVVNNDYESNGEPNPHKSFGYLRTNEFAQHLMEFLEHRQANLWNKRWKLFTNGCKKVIQVFHINRNPRLQ